MAWILNRAGSQAQEGPYEDQQIIDLLRSGQVRDGYVARVGGSGWQPIADYPPFAQALAGGHTPPQQNYGAGHPQPGYGAPQQTQPGYGAPQQTQPGYGVPQQPHVGYGAPQQTQPGYGAPLQTPPGYGAPQQPPPGYGAPQQPPPGYGSPQGYSAAALAPTALAAAPKAQKKKSRVGLIIGVLAGVALLVVGAAGAVLFFTSGKSQLSKSVPDSTVAFVEVTNTLRVFQGLLGLDYVNTQELKSDTQLDNAVRDMATAFEINQDAARGVLLGVESMAVAIGQLPTEGERVATLIGFRTQGSVEPLLASTRFKKEGTFGKNGERYVVTRGRLENAKEPMALAFTGVSLEKDNTKQHMVWFADANILAVGTPEYLTEIDATIESGDKTLAKSESFGQANFSSDSSMIAYVSPKMLDMAKDTDAKKFISEYMNGIKPFAGELSFKNAGMVMTLRGQLKGAKVTEEGKLPPEVALDLPAKLPLGTFAYVAFGSEKTEDGKAVRERLFRQLRNADADAAKQIEAGLGEIEKGSGIKLEDLVDMVGNQMVLGLAAEPDLKFDPKLPLEGYIGKSAAVLVTQVGNKASADKVVKEARTRLFAEGPMKEAYEVKDQGAGFRAVPKDEKLPVVSVFFHENLMAIGVGGRALLAKSILSLGGSESLAGDVAHQSAIASFSAKPRVLFWVDAGRTAQAALDAAPEEAKAQLAELEKSMNFSVKALQLTGDKRVTAGFAAYAKGDAEAWDYSIEALNPWALSIFGAFGSLGALAGGAGADPSDLAAELPADALGEFLIPKSGIPQCDGLSAFMFHCGKSKGLPELQAKARALDAEMTTAVQADPTAATKLGNQCLQDLLKFQRENGNCLQ